MKKILVLILLLAGCKHHARPPAVEVSPRATFTVSGPAEEGVFQRFSGTITNQTEETLTRVFVIIELFDEADRLTGHTSADVFGLLPDETRNWTALTGVTFKTFEARLAIE